MLVAGKGVNLANVVALSANGTAISALTGPDGNYQIQGVPPGQYYVYASPLPPAQTGESYPDNIVPPEDAFGNPFLADTGFDTEFSPGTRDLSQAAVVTVKARRRLHRELTATCNPVPVRRSLTWSPMAITWAKSGSHRRRC